MLDFDEYLVENFSIKALPKCFMVENRYLPLLPQRKGTANFHNSLTLTAYRRYNLFGFVDVWNNDQLIEVGDSSPALTQYVCHSHIFFHCHPSHIIELKNLSDFGSYLTSRNQGPFERAEK